MNAVTAFELFAHTPPAQKEPEMGNCCVQRLPPSADRGLLTPKQAASLLNRTTRCLRLWRATGTGPPYFVVGVSVRYLAADLEGTRSCRCPVLRAQSIAPS
jgi:hypothetical protein